MHHMTTTSQTAKSPAVNEKNLKKKKKKEKKQMKKELFNRSRFTILEVFGVENFIFFLSFMEVLGVSYCHVLHPLWHHFTIIHTLKY